MKNILHYLALLLGVIWTTGYLIFNLKGAFDLLLIGALLLLGLQFMNSRARGKGKGLLSRREGSSRFKRIEKRFPS
ncbi:MAG: hypothetical protein HC880_14100 [Bacteroidia bacterium]|nr:hypothetical protein [Bacteroidia bacterium]